MFSKLGNVEDVILLLDQVKEARTEVCLLIGLEGSLKDACHDERHTYINRQ